MRLTFSCKPFSIARNKGGKQAANRPAAARFAAMLRMTFIKLPLRKYAWRAPDDPILSLRKGTQSL